MRNILLIDDDETTNFLNRITVKKTNLAKVVHECKNGKEAVNYFTDLKNKPGLEKPDFILLDLNMPILDGWQFLDEYQNMQWQIPVYILSSSNYEEDINRIKQYPIVKDYLVKPLTSHKVIELMNELN